MPQKLFLSVLSMLTAALFLGSGCSGNNAPAKGDVVAQLHRQFDRDGLAVRNAKIETFPNGPAKSLVKFSATVELVDARFEPLPEPAVQQWYATEAQLDVNELRAAQAHLQGPDAERIKELLGGSLVVLTRPLPRPVKLAAPRGKTFELRGEMTAERQVDAWEFGHSEAAWATPPPGRNRADLGADVADVETDRDRLISQAKECREALAALQRAETQVRNEMANAANEDVRRLSAELGADRVLVGTFSGRGMMVRVTRKTADGFEAEISTLGGIVPTRHCEIRVAPDPERGAAVLSLISGAEYRTNGNNLYPLTVAGAIRIPFTHLPGSNEFQSNPALNNKVQLTLLSAENSREKLREIGAAANFLAENFAVGKVWKAVIKDNQGGIGIAAVEVLHVDLDSHLTRIHLIGRQPIMFEVERDVRLYANTDEWPNQNAQVVDPATGQVWTLRLIDHELTGDGWSLLPQPSAFFEETRRFRETTIKHVMDVFAAGRTFTGNLVFTAGRRAHTSVPFTLRILVSEALGKAVQVEAIDSETKQRNVWNGTLDFDHCAFVANYGPFAGGVVLHEEDGKLVGSWTSGNDPWDGQFSPTGGAETAHAAVPTASAADAAPAVVTALPGAPATPGAYVLVNGAWKPLPRNDGKVTYNAAQVVSGVLGALASLRDGKLDDRRPDKLAELTFTGHDPIPEVPAGSLTIVYVGEIEKPPADLLQKYPELASYPALEMAPTAAGANGERSAGLYRIVPGVAGFGSRRVIATVESLGSEGTLMRVTRPLLPGTYAVSVNHDGFELRLK